MFLQAAKICSAEAICLICFNFHSQTDYFDLEKCTEFLSTFPYFVILLESYIVLTCWWKELTIVEFYFRASDQKVIVSGVLTKGNADFKADAIKVAHEKPMPQHEKRPAGGAGKTAAMHIQQPRKQ